MQCTFKHKPAVEPILAFYFPTEGEDCIIDEAVGELGRRLRVNIVVLDYVQLAAGSVGCVGLSAPSPVSFFSEIG